MEKSRSLKLNASFVVALAILAGIQLLSHFNNRMLLENEDRVKHALEVLQAVQTVQTLAVETQAGSRGYVITGEERYLEPYHAALSRLEPAVQALRQLTADTPKQQQRCDQLEQFVSAHLELRARIIAERRARGFNAAASLIETGEGKALMDSMRALLADMNQEEMAMLSQRSRKVESANARFTLISRAGDLISVALLIAVFYFLRQEIGRRSRAESELRESRALLQSILDGMGDGVVSANRQGQFTLFNPAAEQILGQGASGVAPEQWTEQFGLYLPDGVTPYPAEQLPLARALRGESVDRAEMRIRRPGEALALRWISVTARPIHDTEGHLAGGVAVFGDVTERKQAEARLQASEARFRGFLESAPEAMLAVDVAGKIVLANAQTQKLFGFRREELLGQPVEMLVPSAVRSRHAEHRAQFAAHPGHRSMGAELELKGVRKDGSEFPLEISLSPLETEEGLVVTATILDVTERKRAENAIRDLNRQLEAGVEELRASNQELDAFSYSVSHDLRAPLRQVHGFAKVVGEQYGPQLDPQGRHYLGRIVDGAFQMGRLIDDLLNLSRLGRRPLKREPTELAALVKDVRTELEAEINGRKVEWRIQPLAPADCDPGLMKQVFANLLGNSLKYTRPCERAVIEVGQATDNGEQVIYVRDNGVGFSMKYVDKLFGVFQRLHRSDEFEGTGVGLATVQRIVQKHGGRIWAEGEEGKGATFSFTLGAQGNSKSQERTVEEAVR